MGANSNPSGNHLQDRASFSGGGAPSTSNGNSGPDHLASSASGMKHNPGISPDWTVEEQAILDEGLVKYASDSNLTCYAKIAMQLPNKTVRDVALRARWLNRKEIGKRRKEDHSKKNKDKRERVNDSSSKSSHLPSRPTGHSCPAPPVSLDNDDGIPYKAIGGPTGELLEQNTKVFQQISANFTSFQVQDNIGLFCQARDNLIKIMNSMNDTPEIMKQMPPLPVKLNKELANAILPQTSHQMRQ